MHVDSLVPCEGAGWSMLGAVQVQVGPTGSGSQPSSGPGSGLYLLGLLTLYRALAQLPAPGWAQSKREVWPQGEGPQGQEGDRNCLYSGSGRTGATSHPGCGLERCPSVSSEPASHRACALRPSPASSASEDALGELRALVPRNRPDPSPQHRPAFQKGKLSQGASSAHVLCR